MTYDRLTVPERISILETQVKQLSAENQEMLKKLDELLALRHKGAGVFWLISILGTGIVTAVLTNFWSIFRVH